MAEGKFTTGDGCAIAWRLDGPAHAPVLLLSNSLGTTIDMWAAQLDALCARFGVLRYDSRGHGASGVPVGAYSIDRLGRDVIELMDELGIERVDFCGLSLGGMVGQWLGTRAPERLHRLIIANSSQYMGPPAGWEARIAAVRDNGMEAITDAVLERWFTPGFRASDSRVGTVRDMLLATDRAGYAGCCAAIRDMDQRQTASLITRPTLIIAGSQDPATPLDHSRALADTIQGAQLTVLDAAHLSNVERPVEFLDVMLAFLATEPI